MQYLGVFASMTLSRLECLLGDHSASLAALTPLTVPSTHPTFYGFIYPPPMRITASSTAAVGGGNDVSIHTLMVTFKPSNALRI